MTNPIPTPTSVLPASASVHVSDPNAWGHVDDDHVIWLHAPEGHVRVAQWEAGDASTGLAFYGRKYDDIVVELDLASRRLVDGRATPETTAMVLSRLREVIAARQFVGDVVAVNASADALETVIAERREVVAAERAAARAEHLAHRERIVVDAESLADSTNWRTTSDRFRDLLEEWKAIPRGEKSAEQDLWKRFSHARTSFDRRRRAHFATVDATRKESAAAKSVLIDRAQALSTSTDWVGTAKAYRDLMAQWKTTPRGSRADDDKLWNKFKAAQDAFFAARTAAMDAQDAEFAANVPAKEALVAEAEALLPVKDLAKAKASLRSIQDRWESAGKVPRADKDRLDRRLAKVEDVIRSGEQDSWRRSNPEARARASATVEQFSAAIAKSRKALDAANASGDAAAAAKAQAQIDATQPLLDAAQSALAEFGG